MTFFFDRFDFEPGARLTGVWLWPWPGDPADETVALLSHIRLGSGQDGSVESDFLSSHLPWAMGGFHGVGPDGDPWLVMVQAAPSSAACELIGPASPWWPMTDGIDRALRLNPDAEPIDAEAMTVDDLRAVYADAGVPAGLVADWPAADLLKGLLAECANVPLAAIALGRLTGCAFPDEPHDCEHDAFRDVLARWAQGLIPSPPEPDWAGDDGRAEGDEDWDEDRNSADGDDADGDDADGDDADADWDDADGDDDLSGSGVAPPTAPGVVRLRLIWRSWKRKRVKRWSTTRVRLQAVEDGWTAKAAAKASRRELVEYLTTAHVLRIGGGINSAPGAGRTR